MDILLSLYKDGSAKQRTLAVRTGHSLGIINRELKTLLQKGYINNEGIPQAQGIQFLKERSPKNAIILAAGLGMRIAPINLENPKALLSVRGEILIERCIKQLQEVGITDIHIVVGFMKEQFEYLIDEYGVKLHVNSTYATKNNLHSLALVADKLENSYIIPSDLWFANNPFSSVETYSWYLMDSTLQENMPYKLSRKSEILTALKTEPGNAQVGLAYICCMDAPKIKNTLLRLQSLPTHNKSFWETVLETNKGLDITGKEIASQTYAEINTYEQLLEFDEQSNSLNTTALEIIQTHLYCEKTDINNIKMMKKGITNRSFQFDCKGKSYIMRIPGAGTEKLIDREGEYAVYQNIAPTSIAEQVIYIDPTTGYKISTYYADAHCCDPNNWEEVSLCMQKLKAFHEMELEVGHHFDLFEKIEFYENLWPSKKSMYRDYTNTKQNLWKLKNYIEKHKKKEILCHIDSICDNFLFTQQGLKLIDWEYAGMQDAHVDLAMFCIYSLYEKRQIDKLIDLYFENRCSPATRLKIYCYIAICGLLWSNWCEYKLSLGVEFGAYSIAQYRYAKDYYSLLEKAGVLENE